MSLIESLGSGNEGRGGAGGDGSWARGRVTCAGSCHVPALLAKLQPVASLSLVAAQEEPGVAVYQMGRRPVGNDVGECHRLSLEKCWQVQARSCRCMGFPAVGYKPQQDKGPYKRGSGRQAMESGQHDIKLKARSGEAQGNDSKT